MKTKFNLLFVMLLSALCFTFTSCSDDDDDDKTTDYAKEITGTYKGDVFPKGSDEALATDATINVTRNSDNNVTLKIDQTIPGAGAINVECKSDVVYSNEKYQVSGTAEYKMGEASFPVTIKGDIDKSGNATIDIEIPLIEISVVYKGKRQ